MQNVSVEYFNEYDQYGPFFVEINNDEDMVDGFVICGQKQIFEHP